MATPEERLAQQAAIARSAHLSQRLRSHKLEGCQNQHTVSLGYNALLGAEEVRLADGSIFYAASNSNGAIGAGDALELHLTASGITSVDQMPHVPLKKRKIPITPQEKFNVKILFSITEGNLTHLFIGGDRAQPIKIESLPPEVNLIDAYISNTSRSSNGWIVALRYSVNNIITIKTITKTGFWELTNTREVDIARYKGYGIWINNYESPIELVSENLQNYLNPTHIKSSLVLGSSYYEHAPGTGSAIYDYVYDSFPIARNTYTWNFAGASVGFCILPDGKIARTIGAKSGSGNFPSLTNTPGNVFSLTGQRNSIFTELATGGYQTKIVGNTYLLPQIINPWVSSIDFKYEDGTYISNGYVFGSNYKVDENTSINKSLLVNKNLTSAIYVREKEQKHYSTKGIINSANPYEYWLLDSTNNTNVKIQVNYEDELFSELDPANHSFIGNKCYILPIEDKYETSTVNELEYTQENSTMTIKVVEIANTGVATNKEIKSKVLSLKIKPTDNYRILSAGYVN